MWGTQKCNNYRHNKTLLRPSSTVPTHQFCTHRHKGYRHTASLVRCWFPLLLLEGLPQQAMTLWFNKPSVSCSRHYMTACTRSAYRGFFKNHWDKSFYPSWLSLTLTCSPVSTTFIGSWPLLPAGRLLLVWDGWAASCLGLCCTAAHSYQSQVSVAKVPGNSFLASPWSPWPSSTSRTFPPAKIFPFFLETTSLYFQEPFYFGTAASSRYPHPSVLAM